jgi:hypothetical protein
MGGIELHIKLRCRKHPQYRGMGSARQDCEDCKAIYFARHKPQEWKDLVFDPRTCYSEMEVADGK